MEIRTILFRLFVVLTVFVTGNVCCLAEDEFDVGYDYLYSSAHRVKVRKVVTCTKNNQQLWNGNYVLLKDGQVCIYRDSVCITRGYQVWLEHTGYYTVSGGYCEQMLVDAKGNPTGVHGEELVVLWNGVICVMQDGVYYLYTPNNKRLGSIYSDELIEIYYNGYYCYHLGAYFLVATPAGEKIKNAYGDIRPELIEGDYWRCKQNARVFIVDKKGHICE